MRLGVERSASHVRGTSATAEPQPRLPTCFFNSVCASEVVCQLSSQTQTGRPCSRTAETLSLWDFLSSWSLKYSMQLLLRRTRPFYSGHSYQLRRKADNPIEECWGRGRATPCSGSSLVTAVAQEDEAQGLQTRGQPHQFSKRLSQKKKGWDVSQ